MIDTDKYEGHTPGPWKLGRYFSGWKVYWFDKETSDNWDNIRDFGEEYRHEDFCYDVGVVASTESNARLMADAPDLLAEVKQLRTDIADLVICLDLSQCPSWFMMKYNEMAQTMWKEGKTWYGQREEGEEE